MIHLWSFPAEDIGAEDEAVKTFKNDVVYVDCLEGVEFNREVFRIETVKGRHHVLSVLDEERDEPMCKECLCVFRTRRLRPPLVIGISEKLLN